MDASVVEIYMSVLLREPTEAEIAFWTEVAENSSLEAVEQAILSSEEGVEAQSLILPVIGLYQGLLERAPEAVGLEFWTNAIAEGSLTFQDLIDEFTGSAEFQLEYPELNTDLSADELAALFYENLLGRVPDAEGIAFWADLLEGGTLTPESFAAALIRTPETQEAIGQQIVEYYADVRDGRIDDPNNEGSLLLVHDEPGEGGEPDDGGSSGGSPRTFSAEIENGVLKFGGTARGDVTASVNEDGQLVFTRQGLRATIDGEDQDQPFSSIAGLGDDTAIHTNHASDVLALTAQGWGFVGTGVIDAFDFYEALGSSSSILLLSDFDVADIPAEIDFESLPEALAEIDSIEDVLALLSTSVDLSIAAANGAKTSLNPLIEELLGGAELPVEIPLVPFNVGLPVLMSGEADTLIANGDGGFVLVGRAALTTTGGTPVIFHDIGDAGGHFIGATERTTNLTSLGVDPDGNALFRVVNTTGTEQWVKVEQVGTDSYSEILLASGQEAIVNVGPKEGSGTTKAFFETTGETFTKAAGSQLAYGGNDAISGGEGDDIIIGLGDAGQGSVDGEIELYGNGTFSPVLLSDIDALGDYATFDVDGSTSAWTAISEKLPDGGNIMRLMVSGGDNQTFTITKAGDAEYSVTGTVNGGDMAFVNVGGGGTYTVTVGDFTNTKSTNNGTDVEIDVMPGLEVETVVFGDQLTGGAGSDIFAYLQGDGVDLITDFDVEEDGIAILGEFDIEIITGLSLDETGEGDDSFIAFVDECGYLQDAGIGILGVSDAEALEDAILNLYDLGTPEEVILFGGVAQAPLEYEVL